MTTFETTSGTTDAVGGGGVRSVDLNSTTYLREVLLQESSRNCNYNLIVFFFWVHMVAMLSLIIYVMTHDANAGTSNFLYHMDDSGIDIRAKLVGVLSGTSITGGIFAMCWIQYIKWFEEKSIWVSIIIAHLIVLCLTISAITDDKPIIAIIYGGGLLVIDAWLYSKRKDFPFSAMMMTIGSKCLSENPKIQCFAYAFMPLQIITFIFWCLGFLACDLKNWAFDLDKWCLLIMFIISYNWAVWFCHLIVHSFITVLAAFWTLGMEGGYQKASQSCKASMTYAQGPIAVGSFIMSGLSFLSFMRSWRWICCCHELNCLWNCIQKIFQRYNEYVLSIVNLENLGFFDASKTLTNLFDHTGMSFITSNVAWSVPISLGTFCGCCISGGMGLAYHNDVFANTVFVDKFVIGFFLLYATLGGSVTAIGLAPLRSVLTTIFVIWAKEPRSFAYGQPELYRELLVAIELSPGVKGSIHQTLLDGSKQIDV